jgi:chloramphenicol-sensitive protein RarD
MGQEREEARAGLLYGLGAYIIWGLMPLYFRAVDGVRPGELLAQRIVWSFILLVGVLTVFRRWSDLSRHLRSPRTVLLLTVSSILLAANWLIYIHSVIDRQVVQASLGYFILPLLSILLGLVFFRERLRPVQWLAASLAAIGMFLLILTIDEFPWIALGVAFSFGFYGIVRKVTPVDGLAAVTIETLLLTPAAGACLAWWATQRTLQFGSIDPLLDLLIVASGVVTAVPLWFFGQAARRLPLSTLGFIQYIGPSVALLLAVFVFGEPFEKPKLICFGLVWTGIALLVGEAIVRQRQVSLKIQSAAKAAERSPRPVSCEE